MRTTGFSIFAQIKRLIFGVTPLVEGCEYELPDGQRCVITAIWWNRFGRPITVHYRIAGRDDVCKISGWFAYRCLALVSERDQHDTSVWALIPREDWHGR